MLCKGQGISEMGLCRKTSSKTVGFGEKVRKKKTLNPKSHTLMSPRDGMLLDVCLELRAHVAQQALGFRVWDLGFRVRV